MQKMFNEKTDRNGEGVKGGRGMWKRRERKIGNKKVSER